VLELRCPMGWVGDPRVRAVTWKRKSPQARRRQLRRRHEKRWSYAYWVKLNFTVYLTSGMSRRQAARCARVAARFVVGRGTARELCELLTVVRDHAEAISRRYVSHLR
jgi:hypothetical protein